MRMAARKNANGVVPKREQLITEHLRSDPLRKLFPDIEQLRIELVFIDPKAPLAPPSPQMRSLYAAAPAFFRFACPCADCDGDFDLTEAVKALSTTVAGRKRTTALTSSGHLPCRGVRFRDHSLLQTPCPMELRFQLRIEPRATQSSG